MSTPLLQKMRTLAMSDATLQGYLLSGTNNTFRWFETQLPKGYIYQGACVTVQQISDVLPYHQQGPIALDWVRVQINIWDLDSVEAKAIAAYLIATWFPSVSFASDAQFLSPPQTPPNCPNFKLSQRGVLDYSVQPEPAWVETLDYRVGNSLLT
jgi:hypothetical protein